MKRVKCLVFTDDDVNDIIREFDEEATASYEGGIVIVRTPKKVAGKSFEVEFGELVANLHPELGLGDYPVAIYECGNQCFAKDVAIVVIDGINRWEVQGFDGNLV